MHFPHSSRVISVHFLPFLKQNMSAHIATVLRQRSSTFQSIICIRKTTFWKVWISRASVWLLLNKKSAANSNFPRQFTSSGLSYGYYALVLVQKIEVIAFLSGSSFYVAIKCTIFISVDLKTNMKHKALRWIPFFWNKPKIFWEGQSTF